jgi:hypothetical protein
VFDFTPTRVLRQLFECGIGRRVEHDANRRGRHSGHGDGAHLGPLLARTGESALRVIVHIDKQRRILNKSEKVKELKGAVKDKEPTAAEIREISAEEKEYKVV